MSPAAVAAAAKPVTAWACLMACPPESVAMADFLMCMDAQNSVPSVLEYLRYILIDLYIQGRRRNFSPGPIRRGIGPYDEHARTVR
jgi:hypothetical protein